MANDLYCDYISIGDLPDGLVGAADASWGFEFGPVVLWLLLLLHGCLLVATKRFDIKKNKESDWTEEHFMTRDTAHLHPEMGLVAMAKRSLKASAREASEISLRLTLSLWAANYCIRQQAATSEGTTEADVRFVLGRMHQIAFATEESTWTRKRNKDFFTLQLRVHKAVVDAHKDLFSGAGFGRRTWTLLRSFQPYVDLTYFSICYPSSMRALLLTAQVFGRVAVTTLWVSATQAALTATSSSSCSKRSHLDRFSEDIAAGTALELLFSMISLAIYGLWNLALILLHGREFVYDESWDAAKRRRQLRIWVVQDCVFSATVLANVFVYTMLAVALLRAARPQDGHSWVTKVVVTLVWLAFIEPLSLALIISVMASLAAQEPLLCNESAREFGLEDTRLSGEAGRTDVGQKFGAGPRIAALDNLTFTSTSDPSSPVEFRKVAPSDTFVMQDLSPKFAPSVVRPTTPPGATPSGPIYFASAPNGSSPQPSAGGAACGSSAAALPPLPRGAGWPATHGARPI